MKNKLGFPSRMFGCLALCAGLMLSADVLAVDTDDESPSDENIFEPGGSCAALAYLSQAQIRAIISEGYADQIQAFCQPEETFECADYSSFLKGLGRLTTGEDGYHCSLQINL